MYGNVPRVPDFGIIILVLDFLVILFYFFKKQFIQMTQLIGQNMEN
jgi:hypothetical protein